MARGSYPVHVPEFKKAGLSAVEAQPAAAAFLNPASNGISITDGQAQPHAAHMPGLDGYELVEFMFADQVVPSTVTGAAITVWERTPDGAVVAAGTSELNAGGVFPRVRIPRWVGARYAVTLSAYDGTGSISFGVYILGRHSATFIEAGTQGN